MVESCLKKQDHQNSGNDCGQPRSKDDIKEKDDYDPYNYGKQVHPTIFWGPVLHLLKTVVGTGILILPHTFKSVGYTIAIVGTIIIAYLYTHVLHILLEVEYELCKRMKIPNLTYLGIVQHSFEQGPRIFKKCTPFAKFLVYFHYVANKSRSNAMYLILIGGNIKIIIDHYYSFNSNIVTIMSFVTIPLILLSLIRNLKFLVPLSMITNTFIIINIILILTIPTNYDASIDLKPVNDIAEFPTFFGIVLGAFQGTGLVLPLKNDMKNPRKFSTVFGVLNIVFLIVTVLYCIFGFLGYLKYGEQLQPNILFNLPPGQLVSLLVLGLQSSAICISYTLTAYTVFDIIWTNFFKDEKMKFPLATEYSIHIVFSILPYFMAIALPDFKLMASIGGIVVTLMDLAVPPLLHLLLLMKTKQRTTRMYWIILKDITLILISSLLFTAGLIKVVRSIVEFYSKI